MNRDQYKKWQQLIFYHSLHTIFFRTQPNLIYEIYTYTSERNLLDLVFLHFIYVWTITEAYEHISYIICCLTWRTGTLNYKLSFMLIT